MSTLRPFAARALASLDLTNLNDDCSDDDVKELCQRAITQHGPVAAVCVWPQFVKTAVRHLAGTTVRVATVVNFPHGGEDVPEVVQLTKAAVVDGCHEIDVVLPYRAFARGDEQVAGDMLSAVREAAPHPTHMKVILETGELGDLDLVDRAARFAITHGADFVKTSTGKTPTSATLSAASVMLRAIRSMNPVVGLKPSGGIKTVRDAAAYLDLADSLLGPAWASPRTFRFGASGLLDDILRELA